MRHQRVGAPLACGEIEVGALDEPLTVAVVHELKQQVPQDGDVQNRDDYAGRCQMVK